MIKSRKLTSLILDLLRFQSISSIRFPTEIAPHICYLTTRFFIWIRSSIPTDILDWFVQIWKGNSPVFVHYQSQKCSTVVHFSSFLFCKATTNNVDISDWSVTESVNCLRKDVKCKSFLWARSALCCWWTHPLIKSEPNQNWTMGLKKWRLKRSEMAGVSYI